MTAYPHPIIAREGWLFLGLAIVIALVVHLGAGFAWALPFWVLALFVLQFFRDPARDAPADADAVLAPADGRVIAIEQVEDAYAGRTALKISVFMNVFNVHSNRAPVDGKVESVRYFPGKFFNANLDKASEANERNAVLIRAANGALVSCVQVAGLIARRILCYVAAGAVVGRGQRFGFIRFGSRVDVYLPPESRPEVVIGEKVKAAVTILARFAEPAAQAVAAPQPEGKK